MLTKKISHKQIKNFSDTNLKKCLKENINAYNSLDDGDLLSVSNFFSALAGDTGIFEEKK